MSVPFSVSSLLLHISTPCTHIITSTNTRLHVQVASVVAATRPTRCAGQGKVVASLDVDHTGSRLLAGSRDYSLRMFDFNGMKSDMRSFRRLEPSDGHPVHSVSLSPTGQSLALI